jgi:hypothetical protein
MMFTLSETKRLWLFPAAQALLYIIETLGCGGHLLFSPFRKQPKEG